MVLSHFRFRGWDGPERPFQVDFFLSGMTQLTRPHKDKVGQLQRQSGKPPSIARKSSPTFTGSRIAA